MFGQEAIKRGDAVLVTKVELQKKDPSRASVFVDGAFAFGLKYEDALFYGLREGAELSGEEYERIVGETVLTSAKEAALKFLSYRMRSRREIEKHLAKKGYAAPVVERAAASLSEYGYINDLEFAKAFASDCFRFNKWGAKKIKYELTLKGVDGGTADAAIAGAEHSAGGVLAGLIEKRAAARRPDETDGAFKRKLFAYLLNKGFAYDEIDAAYAEYLDNR